MTRKHPEQRRAKRKRRSEALLWRRLGRHDFDMGWLLESSDDGLAFAWRGSRIPTPGCLLEVYRNPNDLGEGPEQAVVRRAHLAHDDLVVVGAEVLRVQPFPPPAQRAEHPLEQERELALAS